MWQWIRERWKWIVGGLAAVASLVVGVLTLGRFGGRRVPRPEGLDGEPPPRPRLEEIKAPERPEVETGPRDDYDEKARIVDESRDDVVLSINEKFK